MPCFCKGSSNFGSGGLISLAKWCCLCGATTPGWTELLSAGKPVFAKSLTSSSRSSPRNTRNKGCFAQTNTPTFPPSRNLSTQSSLNMFATRSLRMFRPTARMMRPIPVSGCCASFVSIASELTFGSVEGGAGWYVTPLAFDKLTDRINELDSIESEELKKLTRTQLIRSAHCFAAPEASQADPPRVDSPR